jgi:hypothetical protein
VDEWRVIFRSSEKILKDILQKTGALLIRPRFITELKSFAKTHRVKLEIRSPEGINKLPSSFFVVEVKNQDASSEAVFGLFEYAYGAIRLVAIDNDTLSHGTGDEIIAFFETPVQKRSASNIIVYESLAL